jgi:hypothetical protein
MAAFSAVLERKSLPFVCMIADQVHATLGIRPPVDQITWLGLPGSHGPDAGSWQHEVKISLAAAIVSARTEDGRSDRPDHECLAAWVSASPESKRTREVLET